MTGRELIKSRKPRRMIVPIMTGSSSSRSCSEHPRRRWCCHRRRRPPAAECPRNDRLVHLDDVLSRPLRSRSGIGDDGDQLPLGRVPTSAGATRVTLSGARRRRSSTLRGQGRCPCTCSCHAVVSAPLSFVWSARASGALRVGTASPCVDEVRLGLQRLYLLLERNCPAPGVVACCSAAALPLAAGCLPGLQLRTFCWEILSLAGERGRM